MRTTLVVLLCLATASPAAALNVNGSVGGGYSRADSWADLGGHDTSPHYEYALSLGANGFLGRPGVFDWGLRGSYQKLQDYSGSTQIRDRRYVFYDGRLTLFGNQLRPVSATAFANRSEARYTSDPVRNLFGDSIVTTAGGNVSLLAQDRPRLHLGYSYIDIENSVQGLTTHTLTSHNLSATLKEGGSSTFNVAANYRGQLQDGSWVSDKADLHSATITSVTDLPNAITLVVTDVFDLRIPGDLTLPGAFRQESNAFTASVGNVRPAGESSRVSYLYYRALTESPATLPAEGARNSARYDADFTISDFGAPQDDPTGKLAGARSRLYWHLLADASLNRTTVAGNPTDTSGETLGAQLWLRRVASFGILTVGGGPLVSMLQADGADGKFGHGFTGGASLEGTFFSQTGALRYKIDYTNKLYGSDTWTLVQSANANAGGVLGRGRYNASLSASAFRTTSPLAGTGAGRRVDLAFVTTQGRFAAELRAGLSQGIAGSSPSNFIADGFFIPAPYNSSTKDVQATANYMLYTGLRASATARYGYSVYPGAPTLGQAEGRAAIEYSFGALALSLEDRYTWYEQAAGGRTNVLWLRLSRSFGFRS